MLTIRTLQQGHCPKGVGRFREGDCMLKSHRCEMSDSHNSGDDDSHLLGYVRSVDW